MRGVVSCRCKQALSELRHLKSEAREAGKLLEDKKVLEVKVRCRTAEWAVRKHTVQGACCIVESSVSASDWWHQSCIHTCAL